MLRLISLKHVEQIEAALCVWQSISICWAIHSCCQSSNLQLGITLSSFPVSTFFGARLLV